MDIKPYNKKYSETIRYLHRQGILVRYPEQVKRDDLQTDEGIDIVLSLKRMTPKRFADTADFLLLAAYEEAERYKDAKYKFARLDVKLNRTAKGRKSLGPVRSYTAAKHSDAEIMVYGEEALGYTLPEEYKKKPYLINKIEEIIDTTNEYLSGPYTKKQNPYEVVRLVVSVRAGLTRSEVQQRKAEGVEAMRRVVERSFPGK